MLTRIYGTAFPTKKELEEYLARLEMARQRDHRKLGRELGLFSFHDEGPGFPFFHPKGMRVINALLDYWRREHVLAGYEETKTPIMLERTLWERSGHWDNYKDNMYFTEIDEVDFAVKPMNCPGGILIYKSEQHSYRDFPLRYRRAGPGAPARDVRRAARSVPGAHRSPRTTPTSTACPSRWRTRCWGSSTWSGACTGPSASRRCTWSSPPGRRSPSAATRCGQTAESALAAALERAELPYTLNPGDGAFYGPKIDFHIEDVMGRTWQCATCQLDFAMPERFDLDYVGEDNQRHRPVMIHRTVLGSIERFLAILIEHYGGALPAWLAPVQASVVPVADRHTDYANRGQERPAAAPGCAPRPTCARSRWPRRSATARSARCPSCWWSATARWSRARSPCAPGAARTPRRCRSTEAGDAARRGRAACPTVRRWRSCSAVLERVRRDRLYCALA